jgi:hypothetical protein
MSFWRSFALLSIVACLAFAANSCPVAQYFQFVQKNLSEPFPIISNPYLNPSQEYLDKVNENMKNKIRVCALKYHDSAKKNYSLSNFATREDAENAGWIVTHQGTCGKCSTSKDLFVYLTTDLTRPVRACGVKHFASQSKLRQCIKSLGFTDACTEVWLWNTLNTKKVCGLVCVASLLLQRPYVINGELNKCLQCDEDKSGPIFKY